MKQLRFLFIYILLFGFLSPIHSQSILVDMLFNDENLNSNYSVDSIKTTINSHSYFIENEFVNPRRIKAPIIKIMEYYKDNILIESIAYTKKKQKRASQFLYNHKKKLINIVFLDSTKINIHFHYDSLNRPELVFLEIKDTITLKELATYKDSVVQITTFNSEKEIMFNQEFPFMPGKKPHILEETFINEKKKKVVLETNRQFPQLKLKIVYKLDDQMNWIVKDVYNIINDRYININTVKRKIYYTP